jgi:hypothetical protein
MLIILSWIAPNWVAHAVDAGVEGSGPSLEEAFVGLYNALEDPNAEHISCMHVQDRRSGSTGLYRITLRELASNHLMAISTDILGLSIEGEASDVFKRLPGVISGILKQQSDFVR